MRTSAWQRRAFCPTAIAVGYAIIALQRVFADFGGVIKFFVSVAAFGNLAAGGNVGITILVGVDGFTLSLFREMSTVVAFISAFMALSCAGVIVGWFIAG